MVPANFNQLYYFWVIVKAGSISAAAKRLLLNQSTLSLQMKQLEAALGKRLLLRGRHGVTPTAEGGLTFEYCEVMFSQAEELFALLRSGRPAESPRIRFGASESLSRDKIIEVLDYIRAFQSGVSVRIFTGSAEELQNRLERHRLDLVLSDMDLSASMGGDFRSRLVSSVQLYFLASPEMRKRMRVFPSGLQRIPFLLRAPGNPVRKDMEHFLHRNKIIPNVQAEVEDSDLIRLMALQGQGAAVMDTLVVKEALDSGTLVRLHKNPVGIRENIWFLCRRSQSARPGTQKILDVLMGRFAFKRNRCA